MENCIFCKIAKNEIPCTKVYEDSALLAFMDINPVNKGHLLIIPKEHYEWMQDAPDELISKSFLKTKELMLAMKESLLADFIQISIVGKDVPHFHIHLIPRFNNDNLPHWPTVKYEGNEMELFAEKIRTGI